MPRIARKVIGDAFDLTDFGNDPSDYFAPVVIQFWALGTYEVLFEITGTVSGNTYTDSGTYTFHVGPVAELEVRDAGASPEVARGKRAYAIEAVNHGPGRRLRRRGHGCRRTGGRQGPPQPGRLLRSLLRRTWPLRGSLDRRRAGGRGNSPLVWPEQFGDPDRHRRGKTRSPPPSRATQDYTVCIDGDGVDVGRLQPVRLRSRRQQLAQRGVLRLQHLGLLRQRRREGGSLRPVGLRSHQRQRLVQQRQGCTDCLPAGNGPGPSGTRPDPCGSIGSESSPCCAGNR